MLIVLYTDRPTYYTRKQELLIQMMFTNVIVTHNIVNSH